MTVLGIPNTLPSVTITTDGACRGNPGPGGWAALLESQRSDGSLYEQLVTGEEPTTTTNNAMEIQAVIGGLRALKRRAQVTLRLDSTYVQNGIERLQRSQRINPNTWSNVELWIELQGLLQKHVVQTEWIRGHAGDERNERVDIAAKEAAQRAYEVAESQRTPIVDTDGPEGCALVIQTGGYGRPVRWQLRLPGQAHHRGEVSVTGGITEATAAWEALISGLRQVSQLGQDSLSGVLVQTNYELIVKQGRGEWKVKQEALKPLAAQLGQIRQVLKIDFQHRDTATIIGLLDEE